MNKRTASSLELRYLYDRECVDSVAGPNSDIEWRRQGNDGYLNTRLYRTQPTGLVLHVGQ